MIEASRQERVEVERKMSYQLNAQLNLLVAEINKRSITDTHNGFLDSVLQEDVVRYIQGNTGSNRTYRLKSVNDDKPKKKYSHSSHNKWQRSRKETKEISSKSTIENSKSFRI